MHDSPILPRLRAGLDGRALTYLKTAYDQTGADALGSLRYGRSAIQEPDTLGLYIERAQQIADEADEADEEETRRDAEELVADLRRKLDPG